MYLDILKPTLATHSQALEKLSADLMQWGDRIRLMGETPQVMALTNDYLSTCKDLTLAVLSLQELERTLLTLFGSR